LHARAYGRDVERAFTICGSLTTVLWILYPIAWGVAEGKFIKHAAGSIHANALLQVAT
jgi:bacteriorhodopsin